MKDDSEEEGEGRRRFEPAHALAVIPLVGLDTGRPLSVLGRFLAGLPMSAQD